MLFYHAAALKRENRPFGRISHSQAGHKPDSVVDDHLSRTAVANGLKRLVRQSAQAAPLAGCFGSLAADGVYLSSPSPASTVSFYLTLFTLTSPKRGGIVSVALSLESPPVAVSNRPALCCPDFPHLLRGAVILPPDIYIMNEIR
jgi:hypothetical protein